MFLINVPLGFVAVVGALRLMPESRASDAPTLDVLGAILVALGSGLLIYPLIQGQEAGWPAWTFAMLAAGAARVRRASASTSAPATAAASRR